MFGSAAVRTWGGRIGVGCGTLGSAGGWVGRGLGFAATTLAGFGVTLCALVARVRGSAFAT